MFSYKYLIPGNIGATDDKVSSPKKLGMKNLKDQIEESKNGNRLKGDGTTIEFRPSQKWTSGVHETSPVKIKL